MELPPQRAKTGPPGDPGLPPQRAKTGPAGDPGLAARRRWVEENPLKPKSGLSGPPAMPGLPANPHWPLVSRRLGESRFLKQPRPDLFPGDDIGRVLLVPSDAVIKLRPLRIRQ